MDILRKAGLQTAMVYAARLAGAGLVFAMQAAIARAWGPAALGYYLLIMAAVNIAAFVMPMGFNVIGGYFAALYAANEGRQAIHAFLLHAWRNVAVTALLALLAYPLARGIFGEIAGLHGIWLAAGVLATAMAVVFINGAVLIGLGSPVAGFAADMVFRPLVMIAAFIAVLAFGNSGADVQALVRIAASAYAVIAVLHTAFVIATVRRLPAVTSLPAGEARRWWRFAPPWALFALATEFYLDIDLLLLAPSMSREDLAVFGVCARIVALVAFAIGAVYAIAMPAVVAADPRSDPSGFVRRVTDANLLAAAVGAAAGLGAFVLGPFVLRLFGDGFARGAVPLAVMCLGLTVRALMGPASLVLSLHDRPYAALPATVLGFATLPVANMALVPSYGLIGAAAAAALATTVWSAALWLTALRHTHLDISAFPVMRRALRS
jgi:O-antigen/teichoic acid export membrane protein